MINIELREANIPAHLNIEDDLAKYIKGLLTFSLRVNAGNIVDYTQTEYVNAKKYFGGSTTAEFQLSVKRNVEEKPTIPRNSGK